MLWWQLSVSYSSGQILTLLAIESVHAIHDITQMTKLNPSLIR